MCPLQVHINLFDKKGLTDVKSVSNLRKRQYQGSYKAPRDQNAEMTPLRGTAAQGERKIRP